MDVTFRECRQPVGRNRLILRKEGDGLAVGHELHCRSEDFDHSTRKFDPFTGRADQGRNASAQQLLQVLHLLLL